MENPKQKLFYGWIIAGAGFLLSFFGIGARYSFGVFLKSIETEFNITRTASSGIFSVYMLFCVLFAILGGWGIDKYGPRKIGLIMGTATGISLVLTSMVLVPWQLLVTYSFLLALGTGAIYGVVNTTTSRWFIKKRGFVVGITSSGGGVGAIMLAPFATFLISSYNWRVAFIVVGVISFFIMVFASIWLKKDPIEMNLFPDGARTETKNKARAMNNWQQPSMDFTMAQAFRMKQFWLLGLSWLFLSFSLHMIYIHIVPYAIDRGIAPLNAAFILSVIGIANIFGRLVIGRLSDTIGRKALGVICGVLHCVSLVWLIQSDQLWTMYAFATIFGLLWGGSGTIITSLVGDTFGTRNLGPIMGIITAGWALGAAGGPVIGGAVFDLSHSYFYAFSTGAATLFISACFIACLKPSH